MQLGWGGGGLGCMDQLRLALRKCMVRCYEGVSGFQFPGKRVTQHLKASFNAGLYVCAITRASMIHSLGKHYEGLIFVQCNNISKQHLGWGVHVLCLHICLYRSKADGFVLKCFVRHCHFSLFVTCRKNSRIQLICHWSFLLAVMMRMMHFPAQIQCFAIYNEHVCIYARCILEKVGRSCSFCNENLEPFP